MTFQMVHSSKTIHEDEHAGEPSTLTANVNAQPVEKLILGNQQVNTDYSFTEVTPGKLLISH